MARNKSSRSERIYRLWDSKAKEWLPRRFFSSLINAHHKAELIVSDKNPNKDVGYTVEVLDTSRGDKWLGTYKRSTKGVLFQRIRFKDDENETKV